MATGFASGTADSLLNAFGNATSYTGDANHYCQLHNSSPGSAGTTGVANADAGVGRRQSLSWGTSSGGNMTNDVALTWTNVADSTTYTFFTVWSASTSGSFRASGTISANATTAGDTFTVAIAGVTASLNVAV